MSTEEQKIAELLKPRYKVIADYPGSRFEVGDLLIRYVFETSENGTYTYVTNLESPLQGNSCHSEYVEKLPHLFRKLSWYEDREEKDMPEYVNTHSRIGKVKEFVFDSAKPYVLLTDTGDPFYLETCLPATELEYTTYQLSIKQ